MATVKCPLSKRGYPSHEWNDGQRDRIYCLGYVDPMYEEPIPECKRCPDHVSKAQEDMDKFYGWDTNPYGWIDDFFRISSEEAVKNA